jgi:hypothetical protein
MKYKKHNKHHVAILQIGFDGLINDKIVLYKSFMCHFLHLKQYLFVDDEKDLHKDILQASL